MAAEVISLRVARDQYARRKCKHLSILVHQDLSEVECGDCGQKLNPVALLIRFATEETRWAREGEAIREMRRELDARVRCKCQHCGQMTRIVR